MADFFPDYLALIDVFTIVAYHESRLCSEESLMNLVVYVRIQSIGA